jgi:DNA-binding NarL/FixJ family response regulator
MTKNDPVSFKVLLVEDNEDFRRNLAELLKSKFPALLLDEASNGTEAMEKVESFFPNLVFMDIKLPGQNGLEITRRIKAVHPDIHVVFLTSFDYPEYREAARECGAHGFLIKGSTTSQQILDGVEELWTKRQVSCEQSVSNETRNPELN